MLLKDIRYAIRSLWHAKGFSTVAILCLTIGIGLNTTIFSIVDGVLLKPLPYVEPDRIVVLEGRHEPLGATRNPITYRELEHLAETSSTLSQVGASQQRSLTISDGADPERYVGAIVSSSMFPLLGVGPVEGQGFSAAHDQPGAPPVVMLSYDIWTVRYGQDPGIVGRSIFINGVASTVIGVMPQYFEFPENQKLWIPMGPMLADRLDERGLFAFGRLAPGVTLAQTQEELPTLSANLARDLPAAQADWRVHPGELRERFIPPDVTLVIWIMMAAATLVLFIACSNVANLLLARATSRRREISVRVALGAGRWQILRQLLTESVLLALAAVPFGMVLARAGSQAIYVAMPVEEVPSYITWSVDARALIFTLAIAVLTAVLFGLLPAFQASGGNLHDALKEGTRGNSVRRSLLRSTLVVTQVSLALVALVGALLFVRTFLNLNAFEVGFDTRPLMTMRLYLPGEVYDEEDARARRVEDIVERIEQLAGVEAAFASNMVPISGGGGGGGFEIDGEPSEPGRAPGINFIGVTPGFLPTLGLEVTRGRDFTLAEGWSRSAVALVSEAMASRFWPDTSPIGRRFRMLGDPDAPDWFTIIGIAPDVQQDDIDPDDVPEPTAYVPYVYQQSLNTGLTIRVANEPAAITSVVREEIRSADPTIPVFSIQTMDDVRRIGFWQYGLFGWIFGAIGVGGLVLAAIGVYGVLSYAVSQRTQEIGVRVALGASRREVIRLIVGHGATLAGVGIVVGIALALVLMPLAQSLFYNVSPFDPASFAAVAVFLGIVAVLASWVPAFRATRVDPMIALRGE